MTGSRATTKGWRKGGCCQPAGSMCPSMWPVAAYPVSRYRSMGEMWTEPACRRIVNVINGVDADLRAAESENSHAPGGGAASARKWARRSSITPRCWTTRGAEGTGRRVAQRGRGGCRQRQKFSRRRYARRPGNPFSRGAAVATPALAACQSRRCVASRIIWRTLGIKSDNIVVHETTPDFPVRCRAP